ncbi:MAG: class I SAM-dependent methyltransferase [Planctomycetota bacterium]
MSHEYKDVKISYRSTGMADTYDNKRFLNSPIKQRLNRQFLTAIKGILNGIKTNPPDRLSSRAGGYQINSLLDIPCGTGRIFPILLSGGINFIGADISIEMMQHSRSILKPGQTASLIQCDAERMPFKDDSFDVVTCLRFLTMKVPKEVRNLVFKEMSRVSRAWIIIECRHKSIVSIIGDWLSQKFFHHHPRFNYFSRDDIKKELNNAGIELVRIYRPFGLSSNKWLLLGFVAKKLIR